MKSKLIAALVLSFLFVSSTAFADDADVASLCTTEMQQAVNTYSAVPISCPDEERRSEEIQTQLNTIWSNESIHFETDEWYQSEYGVYQNFLATASDIYQSRISQCGGGN